MSFNVKGVCFFKQEINRAHESTNGRHQIGRELKSVIQDFRINSRDSLWSVIPEAIENLSGKSLKRNKVVQLDIKIKLFPHLYLSLCEN